MPIGIQMVRTKWTDGEKLYFNLQSLIPMRLFEGTQFDVPPRCDACGELESDCDCPDPIPQPAAPEKQTLTIRLEKRKKGKWVTVVSGLDPTGNHLPKLLSRLKNACGAGGTIQKQLIELQGDHVDRVSGLLREQGYRIKSKG